MLRLLPLLSAAVLVAGIVPSGASTLPRHRVRMRALPPISGSIRVAPGDFGHSHRFVPPSPVLVRRRPSVVTDTVEVVRGGAFPQATRAYGGLSAAERWATGGTGVSGLIGNTGNPFAGEATWGTADSATTGIAPVQRFAAVPRRGLFTSGAVDRPLTDTFDAAPIRAAAYDLPAYGSAPAVPFYGSGTPYTMSYYSSGSSAGPYGSPGGLGVYRSGSYGYGPRVIRIGGRRLGMASGGCTCAPRIVDLGRRRHRVVAR